MITFCGAFTAFIALLSGAVSDIANETVAFLSDVLYISGAVFSLPVLNGMFSFIEPVSEKIDFIGLIMIIYFLWYLSVILSAVYGEIQMKKLAEKNFKNSIYF